MNLKETLHSVDQQLPSPVRLPSAAVVAGGLIGGYAVARLTRVRALGGVVLLANGVLAGRTTARALPRTRRRQSCSQAVRSPSVSTWASPTMERRVSSKEVMAERLQDR